jgi:hypothetical protein
MRPKFLPLIPEPNQADQCTGAACENARHFGSLGDGGETRNPRALGIPNRDRTPRIAKGIQSDGRRRILPPKSHQYGMTAGKLRATRPRLLDTYA